MLVKAVAPERLKAVRLQLLFLFTLLNVLQQLDTEVENMKNGWESVGGQQEQLELQLLQLRQVESVLHLSSRFHHTDQKLL